ncbi:hypothetical protein AURDEDRAFT_166673 [Auricularia subglabra TFB-10046 SS5]|nr:hypothetical protein AURDEDRAFT_166673 [Auricularia subglabra TFB-10046 SS5]
MCAILIFLNVSWIRKTQSFVFFSLTLVCALATLLVGMLATEHYQSLLIGFERIFNTVLAGRIVINLRAATRGQEVTAFEGDATEAVFEA